MDQIIYIACQYDEETYKRVFPLRDKPMQAASKYHRLLCEGFSANGKKVCAYSTLPVNRSNCPQRVVRESDVEQRGVVMEYPVIVNFPGIKHILLFLQSFFKVLFAAKGTVVFYDCLVIASSYGACFAAMLRGFPRISIVTDLPEFMQISVSKVGSWINDKLLGLSSGFLFLTEQMNEKVNTCNKPYLVLEGHVDHTMAAQEHEPFTDEERRVLYAGGLQIEYGIRNLCQAFLQIAKPGEVLHIYGDGAYREELQDLCSRNENIVYHGNVPNSEVVQAELNASLLVNPRPAEAEFTKYSFPSKTMEYMASGTPVVMTKLPGMPKEYHPYVHLFESGKTEDIASKLRQILDQSSDELRISGEKAKKFILVEKNNCRQAGKVAKFVDETFG